nr:PREDICTED: uncharacterized protein LOC109036585 [Bemisia tabaci]
MATANVNFELFLRSFINEDSEKNQLHVIPREQYSDLINEVKAARSARNKTPQQKRRVRRFNVIEIGGIEKLVKATGTDDIVYFVPLEEVYGTIEATHAAIGHGGRDRLKAELGRKYANITRPMIEKFLGMCEVCAGKKTKRKRGLVTKPILHKQLNSRCQVDLVDMQSQEIQGKRFILNYQDHLTKFIQLRALSHKTAEEVAAHLKDIFLTFGAPCILHSDNGREFVNNIIKCMKIHWPELQLVNGKPRHSQSQGSIERANQDVENMLAAWLIDKKTNQWPDALPFIQFMKNRAYHAGIRMSPYEALFGMKPRVGLTTSSLTPDMLANVETEEQLEELLASSQVNEENDEENDENEPVTTSAGNTTQTQPPQLSPVTTSAGNTTQTQPPQLSPVATSAGNTTQTQPPQLSPVTTSAGNTTQTQPPQLSPVTTSAGNTTQTQPPQLSPVTTSAGNTTQTQPPQLSPVTTSAGNTTQTQPPQLSPVTTSAGNTTQTQPPQLSPVTTSAGNTTQTQPPQLSPVTTSAGNTTQTQPPQLSPVTTSAGNTTQTQPPQLSPVTTSAGNTTQTQPPQLSPVTTSAGNTTQTQPPQLSPVATSAGNTTQTQPPQLSPVTTSAGNTTQTQPPQLSPVATSAGNTTQTQPPQLSPVTTSAGNVCQSCGADLDTTEEKPEGEHEVLCGNCATRKNIRKARSQAAAGLEQQAKKMRLHSDKTHPPAKVGDNVTIPIPDVDKPRACLRNIIGVILDKNEHELYKIGTKDGILPKRYCRSEFDVCATAFISVSEVPAEKKVTVRAAAASVAGGSAQGFERCNCKKGCTSNQCKCRKNGKLCNSKCHSSLSCNNK